MDLKDEFVGQTRGLWQGNFKSKYDGSIFQIDHEADAETALMQEKVNHEMEAAIAKHGKVDRPESFEE